MATTTIILNRGRYSYEDGDIKVNGDLSINGTTIQNINGQAGNLGSFDAYESGEGLEYNIHFTDPSKAANLLSAVQSAVQAVEEKLAE